MILPDFLELMQAPPENAMLGFPQNFEFWKLLFDISLNLQLVQFYAWLKFEVAREM